MCRSDVAPEVRAQLGAVLAEMAAKLAEQSGVPASDIRIGPVDFGPRGGHEHGRPGNRLDLVRRTDRWEIQVPLVVLGKRGAAPLTMNHVRRWHWRKVRPLVQQIRESVAWRAKEAIPPLDHITVGLHYAPGDRRLLDGANLQATQKAAVDGLVDAGVVKGDDERFVTEVSPVVHRPDSVDFLVRRLWLEITASGPIAPPDPIPASHEAHGGQDDMNEHDETRTT